MTEIEQRQDDERQARNSAMGAFATSAVSERNNIRDNAAAVETAGMRVAQAMMEASQKAGQALSKDAFEAALKSNYNLYADLGSQDPNRVVKAQELVRLFQRRLPPLAVGAAPVTGTAPPNVTVRMVKP